MPGRGRVYLGPDRATAGRGNTVPRGASGRARASLPRFADATPLSLSTPPAGPLRRLVRFLAAAAAVLVTLPGCNDSIGCVFTTGCGPDGGPLPDTDAVPPLDGDWILDGAPTVASVFPSGANQASTTPIVIVFDETMAPESLADAIEVFMLFNGVPLMPVTGIQQFLVGDGRVLVLLPGTLTPGDYLVQVGGDAVATDLTGLELSDAPGARLGTFSVPATSPATPRVVATYPANDAVDQSEIGQVVVVFDRPMLASSVTATSLDVRVGGVDPANDPAPVPLAVSATATDTRVYLYRSVDADGRPAPLGADEEVEVRTSVANAIVSMTGSTALPLVTTTFRTLPFAAPVSAAILSDPPDAIGRNNLTSGDAEELEIEVTLDMLQAADVVDLFLFGTARTQRADPPVIAVRRSVTLAAPSPVSTATFTLDDLDLLTDPSDPTTVRFADGAVAIGMRARRGTRVTPITLLDLDPDPRVIQDPILDVTAPELEDLLVPGGGLDFVTDLRGVSIAAKADGPIRVAEVTTPLGGNGAMRTVVGTRDDGSFLAGPVTAGILAGGSTTYSLRAFDDAFNPSTIAAGAVTQVGVVGPDPLTLGQSIAVHVYDAETLEPILGAVAMTHADMGDGLNYPFVEAQATGADGRVSVLTDGAPAVAAILTVEQPDYDLFTFHGVASTAVSVPLRRSNRPGARASGTVSSSEAGVIARLPLLDVRFDDSRRDVQLPRGFQGVSCVATTTLVTCAYGPETIDGARLGARSCFAGDFTQSEGAFSAALLLQAFAIALPFDRGDPNELQVGNLEVPLLLLDSDDPTEEAAATPSVRLRVDPASGVDLGDLFGMAPQGSVETRVPGLPGSIALGAALPYDQGGGLWRFRGARAGATTAAGALAMAVDTDASIRMEVRDNDGNVAAARPRLSQIQAAGSDPEFRALDVPTVLAPLAGASTGTEAFDVVLRHVIEDGRGMAGLCRVRLLDMDGRGWDLWRVDPTGTADVRVRVVDPEDGGATGLADMDVTLEATAWAWTALSPSAFLWTDVEREFELFSRAGRFTFQKP